MFVLEVRNAEQALERGMRYLEAHGQPHETRGGKVLVLPEPAITVYRFPRERVVLTEGRDANPFFHFFESLWMLAGREDADFVAQFVPRMRTFADDGQRMQGAYGPRWRWALGPQLTMLERLLRDEPWTRRAVLTMWDPRTDLEGALRGSADVPCNLNVVFERRRDVDLPTLDMTVMCRSNDALWGAWGANAVHFSMLQEYLANRLGWLVGEYRQFSANLHYYVEVRERYGSLDAPLSYETGRVRPVALGADDPAWMRDLTAFFQGSPPFGFQTAYFITVVEPMWRAWTAWHTTKDAVAATDPLQGSTLDWMVAAREWILRRAARRARQNPYLMLETPER